MGKRKGICPERLKTIYRRQANTPPWDGSYVPSTLATPQEAPSISRAFIMTPEKFGVREIHLLSTPERNAALLGLYHPAIVGLQEQRMLSPEPAMHPLWTWAGIDRTRLTPFKGVIDVAERLGHLDLLPKVKVPNPDAPDSPLTMVFPWTGDLLWAIKGKGEALHCVNWTVKSEYEEFKRPCSHRDGKPRGNDSARTIARHQIEQSYYHDAGIPTVRVADECIDCDVASNLRQLFLHHRRELRLNKEQCWEIQHKYQIALESGNPPSEVIIDLTGRQRFTLDQCRSLLYQLIWYRQLRVDLFQPVLINRPLHPETRDVLEVYAHWFRGGQ